MYIFCPTLKDIHSNWYVPISCRVHVVILQSYHKMEAPLWLICVLLYRPNASATRNQWHNPLSNGKGEIELDHSNRLWGVLIVVDITWVYHLQIIYMYFLVIFSRFLWCLIQLDLNSTNIQIPCAVSFQVSLYSLRPKLNTRRDTVICSKWFRSLF